MKNKLIVAVLILALAVSQLGAFAFSDMAEERLSWAVEAVEAMTEKNIIKGYEDGSFRPDRAISKEESLILMSRISGFTEKSSEEYKALAAETYKSVLAEYETPYKNEISYLIYRGILTFEDLPLYIANNERTQPLKRYEAAMLITKLMGGEEELTNEELTYDDQASIPSASKAYVAYVTNNELMNGMGENRFEPMIDLTRAQVATLLYRAMNKLDYTYLTGTITAYNSGNDVVTVTVEEKQEKYVITSDVPVALDGNYAMFGDVPLGANIRITFSGEEIVFIDAITPEYEETISLIYVSYEKLTDALVVTFKDPVSGEKVKYPLGDSPIITKNGSKSAITSLKANDLAVVNVVNGKIQKIDSEDAQKEFTGIVDAINFGEEFTLSINVKGDVTDYKVYDDVSIKRNGKAAEISEILVGDSVTLVTKYNVISKITATSKTKNVSGRIVEILISADPRITISEDGTETEYALLNSVTIKRNGEDADVYSLRLGDTADITIEGATVTKILVTAAQSSATISGKVEYIDTTYGYIKLEGVEELIFVDDAKMQKSTGESITLKGIKTGSGVTVFGTQKIGTYEATLVVVN